MNISIKYNSYIYYNKRNNKLSNRFNNKINNKKNFKLSRKKFKFKNNSCLIFKSKNE
jgi:hypothetical protein